MALWGFRPGGIRPSFSQRWFDVIGKSRGGEGIFFSIFLSQKGKGNGFRSKDRNRPCYRRRLFQNLEAKTQGFRASLLSKPIPLVPF